MNLDTFWEFSVLHYANPGVADACLTLQDRYGLDVNLVLFCIWFGSNYGELTHHQLDLAMNFSATWAANVVEPLRQSRRWIKQHREEIAINPDELEKFRSHIKRLELEAEHLQQDRLQQLVPEPVCHSESGNHEAVALNLNAYLRRMGVEKDEDVSKLLATVK